MGTWLVRYLLIGCLLLLSACQAEPPESGLLRVGLAQMPVTLDPRYATDAASVRVQALIHRGLLRLDEHFHPQPDLAASWEQQGALQWRFTLKPDLFFSDGTRLTANDVVATYKAVMDASMASPLRAGFEALAKVETDGERAVVFHLNHTDASLLMRMNLGILPVKLAAAPQQARTTIGCGLFRLREWGQHSLILERVVIGQSVEAISFTRVKDPVTRVLKMTRGELDFVQNDLPPQLLPYLRDQPELHMQTRPSTTFSYIGINLHDARLKDIRVRRALALGIDRERLKRALFADLPVLAETVLSPDHWAATSLPVTPFDLEQSKELLDQAGFPVREDGARFALTYRTSTDPARLRLATAIAAMWQRIGITVHVESMEWGGFYARIKRGDFQLFSLAWVGINDPDIYRWILHSSMWPPHGSNRGRYADKKVDHWLDQAAASSSQPERKSLYEKIEQRMHDDMVYIPLWFDPVIAVSGPRIHGFIPQVDGSLLGLTDVILMDASN